MSVNVFTEFFEFASTNPGITSAFGLVSFFAGHFISNRLAIGRDNRKEFNAAAERIRAKLIGQRAAPTPYSPSPDQVDIDLVTSLIRPWSRNGFSHAIQRYQQARRNEFRSDDSGGVSYHDAQVIQTEIDKILRYLKRR